jgi:hypothetical protein
VNAITWAFAISVVLEWLLVIVVVVLMLRRRK